jgi:hypothetical protein
MGVRPIAGREPGRRSQYRAAPAATTSETSATMSFVRVDVTSEARHVAPAR